MKIIVDRKQLEKGLGLLKKVADKKNTMAILKHVHIQADEGRIRLTATNLETAIILTVPGAVQGAGAVLMPMRAGITYDRDIKAFKTERTAA